MERKSISKSTNTFNTFNISNSSLLQNSKENIGRFYQGYKGGYGFANWRMNKLLKILLAILGGVEVVFYMVTPSLQNGK